jgi:hypothetical protein
MKDGYWKPACGGLETPTRYRSGIVMLYVWHTVTGRHAWLDCATDMILTDEQAMEHMR